MLLESWIHNLFRQTASRRRRRNVSSSSQVSSLAERAVEPLESRLLLTIQFQFDYSLDTNGFFGTAQRTALEFAANDIAGQLNDTLDEIIPRKFDPVNDTWTAFFPNPQTGSTESVTDLIIGDSTVLIYVGARPLTGEAGLGSTGGFSVSGSQQWIDTVAARGEPGALLPDAQQTDFAPWGGSIAFDSTLDWHFGLDTSGLGFNQVDFVSIAAHEIFHVIGHGIAHSWDNQVFGGFFTGANSAREYDVGGPVPLENDLAHWQEGLQDNGSETAMDPTLLAGTRKLPTNLDYASLADIGWEVTLSSPGGPSILIPTDGSASTLVVRDDGIPSNGMSEFVLDGAAPVPIATTNGDLSIFGSDDIDLISVESLDSVFTGNVFVEGGSGNDVLTIDHEANPWFEFDGGADDDSLAVNGPLSQTITHSFVNANDGAVIVDDVISPMVIRYANIEPISDTVVATDRNFEFLGDMPDTIVIGDDGTGGDSISQIASTGTSETVGFMAPTGTITVTTGVGDDSITINNLDGLPPGGVLVLAEEGNDTLNAAGTNVAVTLDGGFGNDIITGGSQADLLRGNNGDDLIVGGDGNDVLLGGAHRDTLNGGGGDDRLQGNGSSGDRLTGGLGFDTLDGGAGTDIIVENGDQNFVFGAVAGGDVTDIARNVEQANITGGASNNLINVSLLPGFSIVKAAGGDDTIIATGTGDIIEGGDGADLISAGAGGDDINGGNGNDTINGEDGEDTIVGAGNDDSVNGGDGDDRIFGAGGRDTLNGDGGNDFVKGQGATGDFVSGGIGNDTLDGGAGNDRLVDGGDSDLTLTNSSLSGIGNDVLISLEEAQLSGGPSANNINTLAYTGRVIIFGGDGDDIIQTGSGHDFIVAEGGNDSVRSGFGSDSVLGASGRDTLEGEAGDDTLMGQGASNDSLFGGPGNDLISGGSGGDRGFGGTGNDTIIGDSGNDVLFGEEHDDSLLGRDGDDRLFGGDGDDTLNGGSGNDHLDGDDGNDGLSGFTGNDFLLGDFGNDTLFGGDDNDTVLGAAGNDTAIGLAGDDSIKGQGGTDLLAGGSGLGAADPGDIVDGTPDEIDESFTLMLPDWVNAI